MSRIARAVLGAALVLACAAAATPTALASVARAPAVRVLQAPAAGKPSPRPSRTPSSTPTPPPKPPPPLAPAPVPVMPFPTRNCPGTGAVSRVTHEPWAQQALGFRNVWALTRGQGVTVAVVDSGVDFSSQLLGRVTARDLTGTGLQDCASNGTIAGHGTEVAAIIAASDILQSRGVPFEGVAPAARILSVKVQNQEQQSGGSSVLANGIEYAVRRGAQVINVSITTGNTPGLQAAVQFALRRNVVIVAAGGNDTTGTGVGPFYPASYPDVLSVGAVDSSGALAQFSDQRSHVAVTAPGVDVTSAAPGGYALDDLNGTSFAAAFVSGVAALVRARYPGLSARQVVARIEATADGNSGPGTGNGLVNPVEAVTAILGGTSARRPVPSATGPVSVARTLPPDQTARSALTVTAGLLGAAALVGLGAVVFREGRRRRWQAGRARLPARPPQTPPRPGPGSRGWP